MNQRAVLDHEITLARMHFVRARYSAYQCGDHHLAESIASVVLQADDLMRWNAQRAHADDLEQADAPLRTGCGEDSDRA